nr:GntR family transcriptional regulator [Oceanobacillus salinisoli]
MPVNKEMVIIEDLMKRIVMKEMAPGSKLPSENELVDTYQVPRMTVRNALTKLEERGYIYSKQGKGRYLKEKSIQIQLPLTGKTSFTEKMEKMNYDLRTENICCQKIIYDPKIYQILHADKNDAVYQIGRLRYINEEPIAIHYSFVSEAKFPKIKDDGPMIFSMFSYYRNHGIQQFASTKTLLSITFPTSKEQQLLSCKSMVPLIVVESDCIDAQTKKVLEHTKILYRSDRFKYDITVDS